MNIRTYKSISIFSIGEELKRENYLIDTKNGLLLV